MKKFMIAAIVGLALLAGGLVWLRGNLDGLVLQAIEKYGSAMTQAPVSVDAVKIDAMSGEGTISGLTIGNPKGFTTAHALQVKQFSIAVDLASVAGEVVTIRKIAIIAPDVIYEKGDAMTNFDAIQKNIANYLGDAGNNEPGGKKLIVEEFTMRGAKAQVSAPFLQGEALSVDLPDLTLRNLGKAKGGIPPGELGQEIAGAMKKQLTKAVNFDKLGKAAKDAAKSIGDAASKAAEKVKNLF